MKACDSCGNKYYEPLFIKYKDKEYVFDSLECAINLLAPICESCGNKIIGHGVKVAEHIFCCDHCSRKYAAIV